MHIKKGIKYINKHSGTKKTVKNVLSDKSAKGDIVIELNDLSRWCIADFENHWTKAFAQ